ncbi:MAG: hypothetical protein ACTSU4_15010 [Promethearchaeota archaeon]
MKQISPLLGLFFCTENNLIYDEIKFPQKLSESNLEQLRTLSFRFLGPIFLTKAIQSPIPWQIERIESSLSLKATRINGLNLMQSFFVINSTRIFQDKFTNLFSIIGSSYTEDIKIIHEKLDKIIHPSILQGRIVEEALKGEDFNFDRFIRRELKKGLNFIEYSLGSPRKIYWESPKDYYCIGVIKQTLSRDREESNLYTCDLDDTMRKEILKKIPSFYVLSILPDYYEHRIMETLDLFNISHIIPSIRLIKLKRGNDVVIYLEESLIRGDNKESYGVFLINDMNIETEPKKLIYYRKMLHQILGRKKSFEKVIAEINPMINPFYDWNVTEDKALKKIQYNLDKI